MMESASTQTPTSPETTKQDLWTQALEFWDGVANNFQDNKPLNTDSLPGLADRLVDTISELKDGSYEGSIPQGTDWSYLAQQSQSFYLGVVARTLDTDGSSVYSDKFDKLSGLFQTKLVARLSPHHAVQEKSAGTDELPIIDGLAGETDQPVSFQTRMSNLGRRFMVVAGLAPYDGPVGRISLPSPRSPQKLLSAASAHVAETKVLPVVTPAAAFGHEHHDPYSKTAAFNLQELQERAAVMPKTAAFNLQELQEKVAAMAAMNKPVASETVKRVLSSVYNSLRGRSLDPLIGNIPITKIDDLSGTEDFIARAEYLATPNSIRFISMLGRAARRLNDGVIQPGLVTMDTNVSRIQSANLIGRARDSMGSAVASARISVAVQTGNIRLDGPSPTEGYSNRGFDPTSAATHWKNFREALSGDSIRNSLEEARSRILNNIVARDAHLAEKVVLAGKNI
jgi:hypothetical protein